MDLLFVHQNMPGQFVHLVRKLGSDPKNRIVFLTRKGPGKLNGVTKLEYKLGPVPPGGTHPFLQNLQNGIMHGEAAARALLGYQKVTDFQPDLIYAHPGWGESLFLKDICPLTPLVHYCEFFYKGLGADSHFDVTEPVTLRDLQKVRTKNAVNLISLESCDFGITPTLWQWRLHPEVYRKKITPIHDGVDANAIVPTVSVGVAIPGGGTVTRSDEVVTYVNRSLEPCRGLFTFARAAEIVVRQRPNTIFLVVGEEDGKYYGSAPPKGQSFKQIALSMLGKARDRVHFLGRLPHSEYVKVLQVSSAHVYLSSPFVLSWSMLEAMSAGCVVIGSNTPPVAEVIEDDCNGLLADFFDSDEVAERILEALGRSEEMGKVRRAARATVVERYSLEHCLPKQVARIEEIVASSSMAHGGRH